jgi:hypothetical protein
MTLTTRVDPFAPGRRWFLSLHSLERMAEMGVNRCQVVDAIEDAEVTYPAIGGGNRFFSKKGTLAVCWTEDVIVTVCPNTYDDYERPVLERSGSKGPDNGEPT